MAGVENLKPVQSKEEARERGHNGGIASGQARQKKKQFKDAIKWLVNSNIKIDKGNIYEEFKKNNIDISKLDPTQLATIGIWMGAVEGNATNYKTLMEANEEIEVNNETPIVEVKVVDNSNLEKVLYEENKHI